MEKVEAIAKHLDMAFPGIISAGAKYCSLQGDLLACVTRRYKSAWLCCAGASDNLGKRKNGDGGKNCGIGDLLS